MYIWLTTIPLSVSVRHTLSFTRGSVSAHMDIPTRYVEARGPSTIFLSVDA